MEEIAKVAKVLEKRIASSKQPASVLRSKELKRLFGNIKDMPEKDRAKYGAEVNKLKARLEELVKQKVAVEKKKDPIDVTAPFAIGEAQKPPLLPTDEGSLHPITQELRRIKDIFYRMGFTVEESRELDDDFNMFGALNFPEGHPARDDYDTFMTEEGLIPPGHTSTMQNRIISKGQVPIRAIIPGRVYRNEDLDATHEHTFHQVEGIYVDKQVSLAEMLGTIQRFLEEYFEQEIEYKTQPFFFPYVEPGLEFLVRTPKFLQQLGHKDDWMELIGCGLIHPEVLKLANKEEYTGFAWGFGVERLVMLKYGIEDIRHFSSGNLDFLKEFK